MGISNNNNQTIQIIMNNIYKALAAFQQECPKINKNSKGYGYKYADLAHTFETIYPLMHKHGLGHSQPIQAGNVIKTILFHAESGESIESEISIPDEDMKGQNAYQALGSGITYMRRYAITSILGIVTDEDTDGNTQPRQPAKKAAKKAAPEKATKQQLDNLKTLRSQLGVADDVFATQLESLGASKPEELSKEAVLKLLGAYTKKLQA